MGDPYVVTIEVRIENAQSAEEAARRCLPELMNQLANKGVDVNVRLDETHPGVGEHHRLDLRREYLGW